MDGPEALVWMRYSWYTKVAVLMSFTDSSFSASTYSTVYKGSYFSKHPLTALWLSWGLDKPRLSRGKRHVQSVQFMI